LYPDCEREGECEYPVGWYPELLDSMFEQSQMWLQERITSSSSDVRRQMSSAVPLIGAERLAKARQVLVDLDLPPEGEPKSYDPSW
jgi:hypothetical protein